MSSGAWAQRQTHPRREWVDLADNVWRDNPPTPSLAVAKRELLDAIECHPSSGSCDEECSACYEDAWHDFLRPFAEASAHVRGVRRQLEGAGTDSLSSRVPSGFLQDSSPRQLLDVALNFLVLAEGTDEVQAKVQFLRMTEQNFRLVYERGAIPRPTP